MEEVRKVLSYYERKKHILRIPMSSKDFFPDFSGKGASISVEVRHKTFRADIDTWGRIRFGSRFFNALELDEPGSILIIRKTARGKFKALKDC